MTFGSAGLPSARFFAQQLLITSFSTQSILKPVVADEASDDAEATGATYRVCVIRHRGQVTEHPYCVLNPFCARKEVGFGMARRM